MTADLLTDPERYLQRFGRIRRKDGAVVPFHFNPPQRRLYQTVQRLRREGRPVRIIILKARQMGFSTLVQGLLFHQAATRRGQRALILAHTEEATRGLFSISRLFYDELPPLLEEPPEDDEAFLASESISAFMVTLPTLPSAERPLRFWKALTASSVSEP